MGILSSSTGAAAAPTQKFIKNVLRISLAARHQLRQPQPRLVSLSDIDPGVALQHLKAAGFFLVALENWEACEAGQRAPPVVPLWKAPLGLTQSRLVFLVGGEDVGLP